MALDKRGLRHQTEASEAGSREPVGISRTTGVTKTCRASGAVAGSETWLLWKVEIIMYVASIHASISTSGLHPDLHWLRCRAPRSARTCVGDHAVMRDSLDPDCRGRSARPKFERPMRAASGTCCVYPVQSNLVSIARLRGPWTTRAGEPLLRTVAATPMPDPVGAARQLAGAGERARVCRADARPASAAASALRFVDDCDEGG